MRPRLVGGFLIAAAMVVGAGCGEQFAPSLEPGTLGGAGGASATTSTSSTTGASTSTGGGTATGPGGAAGTGGVGGEGGEGGMASGGGPTTKRVFVSDEAFTGGAHLGLAGLDALCQAAAEEGTFGGTWIAWASTTESGSAHEAGSRVTGDGPWILVNGISVFANRAQFLTGPTHPIDHNEFGSQISGEPRSVWTGTTRQGVPPGPSEDCNHWTTSAAGAIGLAGLYDSTSTSWTEAGPRNCAEPAHVYCFEQ